MNFNSNVDLFLIIKKIKCQQIDNKLIKKKIEKKILNIRIGRKLKKGVNERDK